MNNILNLGFPLLSSEMPRVLNSLAIWGVVIDALCDTMRYASNSFKMRKYYHEDSYIAMALESVQLLALGGFASIVFDLKFTNSILVYLANVVLFLAVCSISNVTLLCISKFDYTKLIGNGEHYNDVMGKIRSNRTIGGALLVITCIVLRIQIALCKYNFSVIWIIIFLLAVLTKGRFNTVTSIIKKHSSKEQKSNE